MARVADPPSARSRPAPPGESGPSLGPGPAGPTLTTARLRPCWVVAGVAGVAVALGLAVGPVRLGVVDVARELLGLPTGLSDQEGAIVVDIRLPRVVLGLLVGAMLSLAGASYQGVFRNPLADPYLLGAAAGAGLGVTIAVVSTASGDSATIPLSAPVAAFVGALVAVILTYTLGAAGGGTMSTASLILAGVAVTSFLTAGQTYLQQRHQDTIRQVYSFILGGISTVGWREVTLALPYLVVVTVVLLSQRRALDVLAVGDDEATTLGLHARRSRLVVVVAASLGTAAAVSVSGLIGFVGIIVPHTVRLLAGSSHRIVLPCRCCSGVPSSCWPTWWPAPSPLPPRSPSESSPPSSALPSSYWCCGPPGGWDELRGARPRRRLPGCQRRPRWRPHPRRGRPRGGRGEWLSLVGPNGAGRSTLLRYVCGLVGGTGDLHLGGQPAGDLSRRQRASLLALVPQAPVLPPGIAVADYVLLGRTPHIGPLGVEGPSDLAAVHAALDRLDLLGFADRRLATLSGGERQRVFIARALAQEAPILLLDEPTTALDVGHQQQVLDLVDGLRREQRLTVVSTMHDLTLAGQYADRLVLLSEGRVVVSGTAGDVLTEANLARYYDARVRIVDDGGRPVVLPYRG